jgi:hypothetical protein
MLAMLLSACGASMSSNNVAKDKQIIKPRRSAPTPVTWPPSIRR